MRDLLVYPLDEEEKLVVACDSAGGIGPLEHDVLNATGEIVGYYTAAVPLMELVAVGARPFLLANTLSVNPETGTQILRGVERATAAFPGLALTGSMEKNMRVSQTGVGIVALGLASVTAFDPVPRRGQVVAAVGFPLVGEDVLSRPEQAVGMETLGRIRKLPQVSRIVPCGSGGAMAELTYFPGLQMAGGDFPLAASAGPATCILVACDMAVLAKIKALGKPVCIIGNL